MSPSHLDEREKGDKTMTKQSAYEEALALATTLPREQLAKLIGVLSELLQPIFRPNPKR